MKNVDIKVSGSKMTITVDLSKEFGPSASGKTIMVASTAGNHQVDGAGVTVGLNVYKKPGAAKPAKAKKGKAVKEEAEEEDDE